MRNSSIALALALSCVACVPRYAPPTIDQPHATIEIQTVYRALPARRLHEVVELNGTYVVDTHPRALRNETRTEIALVRPEATDLTLRTTFSRVVQQIRPRVERYQCGRGTRWCERRVNERSHVQEIIASCETGVNLTPVIDAYYVVRYEFYGNRRCGIGLYERVPNPDGTAHLIPVNR